MTFAEDNVSVASSDDLFEGFTKEGDIEGHSGDTDPTQQGDPSDGPTKSVNRFKVLIVVLLVAAAFSLGCYFLFCFRRDERNEFEMAATYSSTKISDLLVHQVSNTIQSTLIFSRGIASYVNATESQWPFVFVSDFDQRGLETSELSGALQISFAPFVPGISRASYENFTAAQCNSDHEAMRIKKPGGINGYESIAYSASQEKVAYAPLWQQYPAVQSAYNLDLLSHTSFEASIQELIQDPHGLVLTPTIDTFWLEDRTTGPATAFLGPIVNSTSNETHFVGVGIAIVEWRSMLNHLSNVDTEGLVVVFTNTCGEVFSFTRFHGEASFSFTGMDSLHDPRYNDLATEADLYVGNDTEEGSCHYRIAVYPTQSFEESFHTSKPILYAAMVASGFLLAMALFLVYDCMVRRRHRELANAANPTNAIVSSFFPGKIGERLLNNEGSSHEGTQGRQGFEVAPRAQLKSYLNQGEPSTSMSCQEHLAKSKPIAELFPEVTIMFGDIAGFTAWSSVREPRQVFVLLESVYAEFDEIARRRRVFKVETVGDCYVAACGLPDQNPKHAVVMARFARDCLLRMNRLTKQLEVDLGPDTGDLCMRIGLHSGPVTAGVLRGEKSRLQLFGDTMNTASRMESTGIENRIQVSADTAKLVREAGKEHWLHERDELVHAKGKGSLQTFWLEPRSRTGSSNESKDSEELLVSDQEFSASEVEDWMPNLSSSKEARLVSWVSDLLIRLLRELSMRREALDLDNPNRRPTNNMIQLQALEDLAREKPSMDLDEVQEIIELPNFNEIADKYQRDPELVVLPEAVLEQTRHFVSSIAALYRKNHFHNFEHASHVTMATAKLLSRIVAPDISDLNDNGKKLHDHTYGITTDPLTRFSCVFAALIHDVDHLGVPNSTLVAENTAIAALYKNRSVAEQNSVDLAWRLLMQDEYKDFRRTIYSTVSGYSRFRKLVVNAVLATDIMDTNLKYLRNNRWEKAFDTGERSQIVESEKDATNRKATIVIEHLIQASDVSHTMQHWHIFTKWNERLFREMYKAFKEGRSQKNPADFWYKGELGFFDHYIIPLADKLKACGVFGVSYDEYMSYALKNRQEWELRGREYVESYVESYSTLQDQESTA